jgi:hypothetical protein
MKIPLGPNDKAIPGGKYVVGAAKRTGRAVCWASHVDGTVLRAIFEEVDTLGLARPIVVFGHTCTVGGMKTFRFEQVDGQIDGFAIGGK